MSEPGIYLIVEFDWPAEVDRDTAGKARRLHDVVVAASWIDEIMAGSGGIGGGPASVWVFRVAGYADLDRLLGDGDDEVAAAYRSFFELMPTVGEHVRQEVTFP